MSLASTPIRKYVINSTYGGFHVSFSAALKIRDVWVQTKTLADLEKFKESDGPVPACYPELVETVPVSQYMLIPVIPKPENYLQEAVRFVHKATGNVYDLSCLYSFDREDPTLVSIVEAGECDCGDLRVSLYPEGCVPDLHEYDGLESLSWDLPLEAMLDETIAHFESASPVGPFTRAKLDGKTLDEIRGELNAIICAERRRTAALATAGAGVATDDAVPEY